MKPTIARTRVWLCTIESCYYKTMTKSLELVRKIMKKCPLVRVFMKEKIAFP